VKFDNLPFHFEGMPALPVIRAALAVVASSVAGAAEAASADEASYVEPGAEDAVTCAAGHVAVVTRSSEQEVLGAAAGVAFSRLLPS
jgi:hypothetical protein